MMINTRPFTQNLFHAFNIFSARTKSLAVKSFLFTPLLLASCMTGGTSTPASTTASSTALSGPRANESIETKSVMPVASEHSKDGTGGVLFSVEFKDRQAAGLADTNCRWRMINKSTSQSYFVEMPATATSFFGQLPPGTYGTGRLGCGIKRVWDLDHVFNGDFKIQEGKVSYLGKLIFDFQGSVLREVRKGSRSESAQALRGALNIVPQGAGELISGFTGRTIAPGMYQSLESQEGFDIQAEGLKNAAAALEPMAKTLKGCANTESPSDPLRMGHLEYVMLYKQGKFNQTRERHDENTFSDRFRTCVEHGAMSFQARDKSDFTVKIRY